MFGFYILKLFLSIGFYFFLFVLEEVLSVD